MSSCIVWSLPLEGPAHCTPGWPAWTATILIAAGACDILVSIRVSKHGKNTAKHYVNEASSLPNPERVSPCPWALPLSPPHKACRPTSLGLSCSLLRWARRPLPLPPAAELTGICGSASRAGDDGF